MAHEGDSLAGGRILPSDLQVWAMKDHALCQPDHFVTAQLQAGQRYTLTVEVEHADAAVNDLRPQFQVRTWGSLKGRVLVAWRLRGTLVLCAVGSVLLLHGVRTMDMRWKVRPPNCPRLVTISRGIIGGMIQRLCRNDGWTIIRRSGRTWSIG